MIGRIGPKISSCITGDSGIDVAQHGRRDVARRRVVLAADRRRVPESRSAVEALVVAVVHDARVVRARLRVGAVEVADGTPHVLDEPILEAAGDQHVVGRDARLARVQELAPRDPARRDLEVRRLVDDTPGSCRRARASPASGAWPPPPSRPGRPPRCPCRRCGRSARRAAPGSRARRPRRPRSRRGRGTRARAARVPPRCARQPPTA